MGKQLNILFSLVLFPAFPVIAAKPSQPSTPIAIACSPENSAKINEVNLANDQFIEIYFLTDTLTSDWDLCYRDAVGAEVCSSSSVRAPANMTYRQDDFAVFTVPSKLDDKEGEILLKDSTGKAIDSLSFCNGHSCTNDLWNFAPDCTNTFTNHAVGQTDIYRITDGIGAYDNRKDPVTKGCSNSGCGGGGNSDTPAVNFNCVEVGADGISGRLYTKTTEQSFSLDIIALRNADTIETNFANGADHALTVELVDTNSGSSCTDYSALNPTISQTVTFFASDSASGAGRKTSSDMQSATAYKAVKCRVTDNTGDSPVIGCSADSFAIRPTAFSITSDLNNTDVTGSPMAKTGEHFTITANTASGYSGIPQINSNRLEAHSGAIKTGFLLGSFNVANPDTGTATGTLFSYSEVGAFRFNAQGLFDDSFTAIDQGGDCSNNFSNTPVAGQIGCYFGNLSNSHYIGRFTPDHFELSTATIINRSNESCSPPSSFSYIGETFSTDFTLTAKNSSNTTTENYNGIYAKLGGNNIDQFNFGATDLADATPPSTATALTSKLVLIDSSGNWSKGIGSFTARMGLIRSMTEGPFESFRLGIAPLDDDGIGLLDYDLDTNLPPDGFDKKLLAGSKLRFGRLIIENTYGSELSDLPITVNIEYFDGNSFARHLDDSCTTFSIAANFSISDPQHSTFSCTLDSQVNPVTLGSGSSLLTPTAFTVSSGAALISLSAPGENNAGLINISSSLPTQSWLLYDWDGDSMVDNCPTAKAVFGLSTGNLKRIYLKEVY